MGENISFNESTNRWEPEDVPLIRRQFDIDDVLQVRHPEATTLKAITYILDAHLIRCGVKVREHPTVPQSMGKIRKSVALTKGFRKRTISLFIEADLNHEIRELLSDHATQLDANYFRPTIDQVLQEFLKAEPLPCLDESVRLKNDMKMLRVEKCNWEAMRRELDEIKALFKKD